MRLDPLEIYVMDCFRRSASRRLTIEQILSDCTNTRRRLLKDLMVRMEIEQKLIRRDHECVALTSAGCQYLGLAVPGEDERIEHQL